VNARWAALRDEALTLSAEERSLLAAELLASLDVERSVGVGPSAVGELFEGYGKIVDGTVGSAREFFEALALHRLVWNTIDRAFAERSRPEVEWDSSESLVLSWRAATTGAVMQRARVSDLEFEGEVLSGFSVNSMPLPWVVRRFVSVDSDHEAWAVVWRPGERMYSLVVDRALHPVAKALPARVSTRGIEVHRFATVKTVFGQLAPREVLWHGNRGKWWLSSFSSSVGGLGPLAVLGFVAPDLDGGLHEFVPADASPLSSGEFVELDAHEIQLLMVSLVDDKRCVLPGSDSACPWTLGRHFTFTLVDASVEAVLEARNRVASWRHVAMKERGLEASDGGIELREAPSGFEVVFHGDDPRWNAAHIADLLGSVRAVLDKYAIERVVIVASD
jgi:hypothetical protein